MNQLNSILLEGVLLSDPTRTYSDMGIAKTVFEIESRRADKTTFLETFINVGIVTHGDQAQVCKEHLKKDRAVRVVGRLIEDNNGDICILAEHVEFKAKVGKAQAKAQKEIV